ncbi:MAG TPA: cobyrinate a,c-diamide synthase [Herbaspirillum sp.]|jgi:cobyrinic acid a,c-diamide synthase
MTHHCPALFISAPASNHGKTTVTAALAHFHARQGRRVRVFKSGPDFLDTMILQRAAQSAAGAYQLDLWLAGADECRALVHAAAAEADLILIEGVMGLFDGEPSSADLAQLLDVPVLAVIDASGAAQTVGAVGHGLAHYRDGLKFAGLLANAVASPRHAEMIEKGMRPGLPYLGGMPRDAGFRLPARHLGLLPASEIADLDARLDSAADAIGRTGLAALPAAVGFEAAPLPALRAGHASALRGVRIGIASDAAFAFLYQANLDLLRAMGAQLLFFSPLADAGLPDVDGIYLPGGYPELHLQALQDNRAMHDALRRHHRQGKPIYAECGGMLYLLESLADVDGRRASMAGLLRGDAAMQPRLQGLGYQSAAFPGGMLRAHTFHHSIMRSAMQPIARGERLHNTSAGEAVYREGSLVASYLHAYFPSNPVAAAALFAPGASPHALKAADA